MSNVSRARVHRGTELDTETFAKIPSLFLFGAFGRRYPSCLGQFVSGIIII